MQRHTSITFGIERLESGRHRERHQHSNAYATLVFDGSFQQMAYAGHFIVAAGDIILQPTLDCHSNLMLSDGVVVLRLPMGRNASFGGVYGGHDLDPLRRAASRDAREASDMLGEMLSQAKPRSPKTDDWEDLLSQQLRNDQSLKIQDFAAEMRISREALSRGFKSTYGISPTSFRSEIRAREAWLRITSTQEPLSDVAVATGFVDQPHMSHSVKALTGATPLYWRTRFTSTEVVSEI